MTRLERIARSQRRLMVSSLLVTSLVMSAVVSAAILFL
jgi:hypothetical protein